MAEPVTVIIPTCNRKHLLRKAIGSVLAQTYPHFELIVVDDGPVDDGTAELVASYGPGIIYKKQENRGPAAARNTGIRTARHELIVFLDDDDRFEPRKLAIQVGAMLKDPASLISHTQEIWYRHGKHLNQKKKHRKNRGDIFAQSLKLCAVSMSTVMVRRELFDRVGLFDEELPCCEDYDFWLRVSVDHPFLLIAEPLTFKDGGRPDQVSRRYRIGMDRFRIRAIEKILSSSALSLDQRRLARDELVRKCTIYGNGCIKHGRPEEGRYYLDLARRHAS